MPIVWGINASKIYTAVWITILAITLLLLQIYVLQFHWWLSALYCLLFIFIPLVACILKLFKAQTAHDFHSLKQHGKIYNVYRNFSMIFFRFYY